MISMINQHKLIRSIIVGNFYLNKIITSDFVFYILYMIITFNPQWSEGNKELMIDNPLDSPFDTFRIQMILKILDICGKKLLSKTKENLDKFIEFLQMYILSKQYLSIEVENKITTCFDNLGGYTIFNDFGSALKNSSVYKGEMDDDLKQFEEKEEEKIKPIEKKESININNNVIKKNEEEEIKEPNFDDELQKIISESLTKVQGASVSNAVINPFMDVKKKELNKNIQPGKMRLFTKSGNKIIITEIDKEAKKEDDEEGEEDDDYYGGGDDDDNDDDDEDYNK